MAEKRQEMAVKEIMFDDSEGLSFVASCLNTPYELQTKPEGDLFFRAKYYGVWPSVNKKIRQIRNSMIDIIYEMYTKDTNDAKRVQFGHSLGLDLDTNCFKGRYGWFPELNEKDTLAEYRKRWLEAQMQGSAPEALVGDFCTAVNYTIAEDKRGKLRLSNIIYPPSKSRNDMLLDTQIQMVGNYAGPARALQEQIAHLIIYDKPLSKKGL